MSFPSQKLLITTLYSSFKWLYPRKVVSLSNCIAITQKIAIVRMSMIKFRSSYAVITNNAI